MGRQLQGRGCQCLARELADDGRVPTGHGLVRVDFLHRHVAQEGLSRCRAMRPGPETSNWTRVT